MAMGTSKKSHTLFPQIKLLLEEIRVTRFYFKLKMKMIGAEFGTQTSALASAMTLN